MFNEYRPYILGNYYEQKPYETEYIELVDEAGSDCEDWIYQYCQDQTYGPWAKQSCALTCSKQEA